MIAVFAVYYQNCVLFSLLFSSHLSSHLCFVIQILSRLISIIIIIYCSHSSSRHLIFIQRIVSYRLVRRSPVQCICIAWCECVCACVCGAFIWHISTISSSLSFTFLTFVCCVSSPSPLHHHLISLDFELHFLILQYLHILQSSHTRCHSIILPSSLSLSPYSPVALFSLLPCHQTCADRFIHWFIRSFVSFIHSLVSSMIGWY